MTYPGLAHDNVHGSDPEGHGDPFTLPSKRFMQRHKEEAEGVWHHSCKADHDAEECGQHDSPAGIAQTALADFILRWDRANHGCGLSPQVSKSPSREAP